MTIMEFLKTNPGWDIKVLGTDISTKVLAFARAGQYTVERMRGVPPLLRNKYFVKTNIDRKNIFTANQTMKNMAVFRRLNLMDASFPFKGKFDIIFCRNVMIYFDKETQCTLVNKFHTYLHDDGYLFIGHAESLIEAQVDFKRVATATFKKK